MGILQSTAKFHPEINGALIDRTAIESGPVRYYGRVFPIYILDIHISSVLIPIREHMVLVHCQSWIDQPFKAQAIFQGRIG